ncbi:hypothetical protein D1AOALGA4SA_3530 [Olavius algarvensis Delta 1 endosymbiont]|nr:hypothetical protein D1AOALGA4SA_3530 [Olavius algarvensis Delta 1 endosymbiont]
MRTPNKETELTQQNKIKLYTLDVTDENSVDKATEGILSDFGTVDVVTYRT